MKGDLVPERPIPFAPQRAIMIRKQVFLGAGLRTDQTSSP